MSNLTDEIDTKETTQVSPTSAGAARRRFLKPSLRNLIVFVICMCLTLQNFFNFKVNISSPYSWLTSSEEIIEEETINLSNDASTSSQKEAGLGPRDPKRLNVLLLYPDDWRHDTIGSEKPYILTPFLDSLAKQGIRFTHNAVTTSVCWMSRATLWSGQYSSRHKSYKLKCPWMATPENWKHSWVSILREKAGYFVGHYGKWQYYTDPDKYTSHLFDWACLYEGWHWDTFGGRRVHASDFSVDKANEFFDKRPKDKPFVLSVAFYPPKALNDSREPGGQLFPKNETEALYENITIPEPEMNVSVSKLPDFLQKDRTAARQKFYERYRTKKHFQTHMKKYYALVTGIDRACKAIVDRLKSEGLYDNTMIIFTTDNGMFHGAHGLAGKWYPYQESIRVPLIIYDPRMPEDKRGTLDDSLTLNIDLAETILGAAGIKPDELMQGRDISELYLPPSMDSEEKASWRDEFFYEFPSPEEDYIPSSTALVRKDWKYIKWQAYKREQFFNLKEDPLEQNDLWESQRNNTILTEMRRRHDELLGELHDPSYVNDEVCDSFKALNPDIQ